MKTTIVLATLTFFMTACGSNSTPSTSTGSTATAAAPAATSTTSAGTSSASVGSGILYNGNGTTSTGTSTSSSTSTTTTTTSGSGGSSTTIVSGGGGGGTTTTTGSSSGSSGSSTTTTGGGGSSSSGSSTTTTTSPPVTTTQVTDINGSTLVAGQSYFIRMKSTTQCIDVTGGNATDGNQLQMYDCIAGNPNQNWTLQINADGSFSFPSALNSSMCLDIDSNAIQADGAIAQIWDCTGVSNQSYSASRSPFGGFQLASMMNLFQCVQGDVATDAMSCAGTAVQAFEFIPAANPDPANANEVVSSNQTTTCAIENGPNLRPSVSTDGLKGYLLATAIQVSSPQACDAYCAAYGAATCLEYPDTSGVPYCFPLTSLPLVTANSSLAYAAACTTTTP